MHTRLSPLIVLVGLAACKVDYGIERTVQDNPAAEDTAPPPTSQTDSGLFGVAWCGVPDLAASVAYDESCEHEREAGPMAATVEWEIRNFGGYGEYSQTVMAPVVGQLTDDDGDGDVDRDDTPDIVIVTDDGGEREHRRGVLRVLPGDGSNSGASVFRGDLDDAQLYPYRYTNAALGDVDNDGQTEIVLMVEMVGGAFEDDPGGSEDTGPPGTSDGSDGSDGTEDVPVDPELPGTPVSDGPAPCFIAAFNADLTPQWVAGEAAFRCGGHAPALADLDGDGAVEVVVGSTVVAGDDGRVLWQGDQGTGAFPVHPEVGYHSVPLDLDLDGFKEVLTGQTLYAFDGEVICSFPDNTWDGFVAAADLDEDGLGEVVSVGGGTVRVFERDCTITAEWSLSGGGNGGMPTIADFDVDGSPEIGVADATTYSVYEPTGEPLWSQPVQDASSHMTGSLVFDFENDGHPEVVYADETRLWVFDGRSGEVRLEDTNHASRTLHEYPTVADVDNDGSTEIIVPCGGGHGGENSNGLYVLGPAEGETWTSSRLLWNQHAYSITNVMDDLSIPSGPSPNWPTWNNFRSGDVHPRDGASSPDAVPVGEVCLDECIHGRVVAHVRLGNAGAVGLRNELPISFYAQDAEGGRVYLQTEWVPEVVDLGSTSAILRVTFDSALLVGKSLVAVVDDHNGAGLVEECSEANNEQVFPDVTCR